MKKIISLTILLILGIAFVNAEPHPRIIVQSFNIKEGSISPGSDFILSLTLTNTEPKSCAYAITSSIQAGFPFIQKGISTVESGNICYGSSKSIDFPLKIDPSAIGGFNQISVQNTYETVLLVQSSSTDTINLFINGSPNIRANIQKSDPIDIYPGDNAQIGINVENFGSFDAQSVVATLNAESPIEVKWSNQISTLGTIKAKQSKVATFTIQIPKDAKLADYPINLNINFNNENLELIQKNIPLILHIKPKAQFKTSDVSNNLFANDNTKKVSLMFHNSGTDTANKIKIKLQPQFPFSADGSIRYIETLSPGQSTPIDIVVNVDKDATLGAYGLEMLVDFEDPTGKKLQESANLSLTIDSKNIIQAVFLDFWFLWIVIVLIGFMVIRKRAKTNKKQ